MKRFFIAALFLLASTINVFAAGTISLSLTQQLDQNGKPLNGGLLYTYAAGTTTPQNAYQDSGLTIPYPNPMTLNARGFIPQLFFADGQIKVRLTNAAGVVQLAADNLLVVGPSGGGGGGGSVDPTTVLSTGDMKCKYGTGVLTGFVRWNGRTIGSATSGATERANADSQALFEYLWQADANLVVSTGRGVSANADWVANKTITLPDGRGRVWAMLDDMGNSSAARLASVLTGGANTTLGSAGGTPSQNLAQNVLPNAVLAVGVTGNIAVGSTRSDIALAPGIVGFNRDNTVNAWVPGGTGSITSTGVNSMTGNTSSINGGVTQVALQTWQPTILTTCYGKL